MPDESGIVTIACDCNRRERREAATLLARPAGGVRPVPNAIWRTNRGLRGWLIFVAIAALLFLWLRHSQPPRSRRARVSTEQSTARWLSTSDQIALGALATGTACITLMFVLAARWGREKQSRWDGRQFLAFDYRGITQIRPGHTHLIRWVAIRGFDEGQTVFVLRPDKRPGMQSGIIVPKRPIAGDAQCDRLRELLRHHATRPAVPIPLGFEVSR